MSPYRRILVIMTKTEPRPAALRRALALADASGAALHVLAVHEPAELQLHHALQEPAVSTAAFAHFSAELKALLDEQGAHLTRPSFEAVQTLDARDFIPAYIAKFAPDLVIKDCPVSSMVDQIAQTSLDYALLHAGQGAFQFVPANAPAMPAQVLIAVDVASPQPAQQALNHQLVEAGQQLARLCKGQAHLLSAYDLPMAMLANAALAEPWAQEVRESLRVPFDALADAHGIAYSHRYFVEGAPLRTIKAHISSLMIDVVVVGVVQPKRWAKLIGDTTDRLLGNAPCSILAIRPKPAG
ncbi:universal stress protein [Pseudomonas guariconensis]|uniref:universal stress protein n=1 Tax=Pseudomonas guariconensis TaxID=1288410 RepID=UPI002B060404|nr:universal stress protein [Pseudomonas guariconensis]